MSPSLPPGDGGTPEIEATELKALLDEEHPVVLVDVREPFEKDIADLPEVGQLRIPMAHLEQRLGELDPEAETVIYCRSGSRSAWATQLMRRRGFTRTFNLRGGILAWRRDVDPSLQAY